MIKAALACALLASSLVLAHAAPPATAPAKTVTVTETENNGKVTIAPGGTLVVRLASNVTTGFSWSISKDDPKALRPVGKPKYEPPKQAIPGAGGHQVFSFHAAAPEGTDTTLTLEYKRPFERDKPAAQTFTLNVHVGK